MNIQYKSVERGKKKGWGDIKKEEKREYNAQKRLI